MTEEGVFQILKMFKSNYSYAFKNLDVDEKTMMVKSWAIALRDVDFDLATIAAMKIISSSKWMPTAAELREKVKSICEEAVYELAAIRNAEMLGVGVQDAQKQMMLRSIADRAARYRGDSLPEIKLDALLTGETGARLEGGTVCIPLSDNKQQEDEP